MGPAQAVFVGAIDDLQIVRFRALAQAEVAELCKTQLGWCVSRCATPPTGLGLWLPFDAISTPTTPDLAGAPNPGTYAGGPAASCAGIAGPGLGGGGGAGYIAVANAPEINLGADFSIDAWVTAKARTGLQVILDKRSGPPAEGYHLFLQGGRLGFQMANGNGFLNVIAPPDSPNLADGLWHFVAVTVDRTLPCINGTLWIESSASPALYQHHFNPLMGDLGNPAELRVGAHSFTPATRFQGCIDELEIFPNRALSEVELKSIRAAQWSGKCKQ